MGAIEDVRASVEDTWDEALVAIGWPDRHARRRLFEETASRLGWRVAA
jgi:hypothetical protein